MKRLFFTCVKWCGISHANIWEIFRGPFLNLVTKNRWLTFLNLICYLTILLDNEGCGSLPQVSITLGRLPSVPIPLNLPCCFLLFIWIIDLYEEIPACSLNRSIFFHCVVWNKLSLTSSFRFVFIGHQVPMQTHFLALDICQLIDKN